MLGKINVSIMCPPPRYTFSESATEQICLHSKFIRKMMAHYMTLINGCIECKHDLIMLLNMS
jgi:hypothetical protein